VRTGAFTTAQDVEIVAAAFATQVAKGPTEITSSTKGPVEVLKEATTSLDYAD